MHHVLRESTCRAGGKRRKVARRILNSMGGMSGYAHFLNDSDRVRELQQNMKFADSLEAVKHAERDIKARAAKEKRDKAWGEALKKMGLNQESKVYKKHVRATKLTIAQMKAVGFVECCENINGNAAAVRRELLDLLPECPTNEEQPVSDSGSETEEEEVQCATQDTIANTFIDVSIEDMTIGDVVEVFWKGDNRWYEGRITDFNPSERQFEVFYFSDDQHLNHNESEYKVRKAV